MSQDINNIDTYETRTKVNTTKWRAIYEVINEAYIKDSNRWWNDWIFQLHCNKLEWVDPKSTPKRVKPFSVSSKKNDRTAHFVGNSELKELDINDFFKKKTDE